MSKEQLIADYPLADEVYMGDEYDRIMGNKPIDRSLSDIAIQAIDTAKKSASQTAKVEDIAKTEEIKE